MPTDGKQNARYIYICVCVIYIIAYSVSVCLCGCVCGYGAPLLSGLECCYEVKISGTLWAVGSIFSNWSFWCNFLGQESHSHLSLSTQEYK